MGASRYKDSCDNVIVLVDGKMKRKMGIPKRG
jgi:hypothetical protein